jgi:hypothetical protein
MTKRSGRRNTGDFPVAAVAAYGPDNTRATKLVVSILKRAQDRSSRLIRTWTVDDGDVRTDETIQSAAATFIAAGRVKRTTVSDGIVGCPHEEGVDYPMGRACPLCPFWANIDRCTHEPLMPPVSALSPEEILTALADDAPGRFQEAVTAADAHRDALTERLLEALERGLADPGAASQADASLFSYALYLMAKWRETRAYPYVIRWLGLPDEEPFEIAGDIVTMDGSRILAAVCDGNLDPITSLIVNRHADEWGRSAGINALAHLAAWAELPRSTIVDRYLWLAREGLERQPSPVWDSLAYSCADIEAIEVFPELRRAYDDGLINPQTVGRSDLDDVENVPRGEMLRQTRERRPIEDVAKAVAWWDRRSADSSGGQEPHEDGIDFDSLSADDDDFVEVSEPYRAPPKVGRNEPCPCGSGKKYKKCCGA